MLGFKSLWKLYPANGPSDGARQLTKPSSCKRNRINGPSAETGLGLMPTRHLRNFPRFSGFEYCGQLAWRAVWDTPQAAAPYLT
jgi:hypothetical protein